MPAPERDAAHADVIVVGAGASGSVVAARASEDPNRTVLLIDAGPDYPLLADTPDDLRNGHDNSYVDHDWAYRYLPVAEGREVAFPRGRVTGGSSAVNTCIALRGVPEDYDGWAALGNDQWSWARVLPAFRRLERDLDFGDRPYHGDAGPIPIRRSPAAELHPVHAAFIDAATSLGHPYCPDANDPGASGAGPQPMNKLGRLRVSTAVGYLAPARIRPNLTVRGRLTTRRLLITDGRVRGVEVEGPDGQVEVLRAPLVVLAAGAVGSPAVLWRSGVGPRSELERLGIEVVADVPAVGANLDDHPGLLVLCQARRPDLVDTSAPIIQSVLRWTADGSPDRNDLFAETAAFARAPGRPPAFAVLVSLFLTRARGRVRLATADPHAPPVIESGFGTEPDDDDRLARALREGVRLAESAPLADLVAEVLWPRLPLDRDAARALARTRAGSGYHPCGTVRMGPADDRGAVVDQYGRCRAVDGLVVADASVMPFVPRANTNLTSIMIGERVGEWLRTDPSRYGG